MVTDCSRTPCRRPGRPGTAGIRRSSSPALIRTSPVPLSLCTEHQEKLLLSPVSRVLLGLGMLSFLVPLPVTAMDTVSSVSPANATHSASIARDVVATLTGNVTGIECDDVCDPPRSE